jgi:hypothetical protein
MITRDITTNGIKRTITGKLFADELRVYRIEGDITNTEELKTMAQELAIQFNCSRVTLHI